MAKAYRSTTRRVVKRTERVPAIHLVLSEGEADFLLGVLSHVVPTDGKTPGKYANRLMDALEQATGQHWQDTDAGRLLDLDDINFGLKFRPYSELPKPSSFAEYVTDYIKRAYGLEGLSFEYSATPIDPYPNR